MSQQPIKLVARLDATEVDALQDALLECLDAGGLIQLDASAVDLIDTPPIQLLLGLKRQAEKSMQNVEILSPSAVFSDALDVLGLDSDLNPVQERSNA